MSEANDLATRVAERIAEGAGESIAGASFLPLFALDSGAVIGLDATATWVIVPDDGRPPIICVSGAEHALIEAIESKREDFDAQLEAAAREKGLPPEAVSFAFPAVALVRGVLSGPSAYLIRLALRFLRPTELRDVRAEIVAIAESKNLPGSTKDLAKRLIVPL